MQIDKATIIEHLKALSRHDDASKAQAELPDKVDTDKDAGLLSRFGISPDMLSKLGGAGGLLDKAKSLFEK
jgi:hypothetical protein